jgi:hypothetical protein
MKRFVPVLLLAALLAVPAAAVADDQALWDTVRGSTQAHNLDKATKRLERAVKRAARSDFRNRRRTRAAVRAIPPVSRLYRRLGKRIAAVKASSGRGRKAKSLLRKSLRGHIAANRAGARGLRAYLRGRRSSGDRQLGRASALSSCAARQARRADKLLRQAGVDTG